MTPLKAILIASGNELLSGRRTNTNAVYLSQKLTDEGFLVIQHLTLGDQISELKKGLESSIRDADLVVITGGLGPTLDDLTREALCEATKTDLEHSSRVEKEIRQRFKTVGRPMSENNLVQAKVPTQGGWFSNPNCTAPGLWFDKPDCLVVALPGPPREMIPMVERDLLPLIKEKLPMKFHLLKKTIKIIGVGESSIEEKTRPIILNYPNLDYSILASPGQVTITLSRFVESSIQTDQDLKKAIDEIRCTLGSAVFTDSDESAEEVVGRLLKEKNLTLSTAESCTGGLIAESITRVAGSSEYFLGAVVAYSNELKQNLLSVPEGLLQKEGAVSAPVAEAMALGAVQVMGTDLAISVTGIAGPGGGTKEKPVGLVYIGIADKTQAKATEFHFFGDRETIRERTRVAAFDLLRKYLLENGD